MASIFAACDADLSSVESLLLALKVLFSRISKGNSAHKDAAVCESWLKLMQVPGFISTCKKIKVFYIVREVKLKANIALH